MGVTGFLSRSFLFGFNNTEVIGLDRFLEVLDGRKDVGAREKGLLTGTLLFQWFMDDRLALMSLLSQYQII
jgi:hypothetical protein